jgi:hypothetical protein
MVMEEMKMRRSKHWQHIWFRVIKYFFSRNGFSLERSHVSGCAVGGLVGGRHRSQPSTCSWAQQGNVGPIYYLKCLKLSLSPFCPAVSRSNESVWLERNSLHENFRVWYSSFFFGVFLLCSTRQLIWEIEVWIRRTKLRRDQSAWEHMLIIRAKRP